MLLNSSTTAKSRGKEAPNESDAGSGCSLADPLYGLGAAELILVPDASSRLSFSHFIDIR